jgi:hypothetical protein
MQQCRCMHMLQLSVTRHKLSGHALRRSSGLTCKDVTLIRCCSNDAAAWGNLSHKSHKPVTTTPEAKQPVWGLGFWGASRFSSTSLGAQNVLDTVWASQRCLALSRCPQTVECVPVCPSGTPHSVHPHWDCTGTAAGIVVTSRQIPQVTRRQIPQVIRLPSALPVSPACQCSPARLSR